MRESRRTEGWAAVLAAAVTMLVAAPALAGSLRVSSNGVDSGTCGIGSEAPCATIAQAVTNAADGDSISVGPGTYAGTTVGKSLSLTSSAGTGGAVLSGPMVLAASGIEFGKRGKGFSLTGSGILLTVAGDEVVVRGNLFSDCSTGIEVTSGLEAVIRDNSFDGCSVGVAVLGATGTLIRGNRFGYAGSTGVFLGAGSSAAVVRENRNFGPSGNGYTIDGANHVLSRNLAHGTPGGGFVATGLPTNVTLSENLVASSNSPSYLLTVGTGWILNGNAAVNAGAPGFYLSAGTPLALTGNAAIGCSGQGFLIVGGNDHVLVNNAALNNSGSGLTLGSTGTGVTVTGGNLYGNSSNCGLENSSPNAVTATDVYWGDPAGPGLDPADGLCGNVGVILVDSPASSPARIRMPGIK